MKVYPLKEYNLKYVKQKWIKIQKEIDKILHMPLSSQRSKRSTRVFIK